MHQLDTFKFFNNKSPTYMNVFKPAGHPSTNTRASFLKLNQPLRNTKLGRKTLSYMASYIWDSLPVSLNATEGLNIYKHRIKKFFLAE